MDPVAFQRKWIGVVLKERSAAQEHFLDLCRVLDVPTPEEVAPDGFHHRFVWNASKTSDGNR